MTSVRTNAGEKVGSDTYQGEYRPSFVEKWDELIDWEGRARGENGFFEKLLRDAGCERVLDAATGTGYHAVMLAKAGFEVAAADGAETMLEKTEENMREWGVEFPTYHADWRWLDEQVPGKFDAVLCLGNALTHLKSFEDRQRAVTKFFEILEPGGLAVIDQRNYDKILDRGYSSKHRYYYVGEGVNAYPETVNDELVRFRYEFPDGESHHLTLFPLRQEELTKLLADAGFEHVERYGDFEADYEHADADFIVQVGRK